MTAVTTSHAGSASVSGAVSIGDVLTDFSFSISGTSNSGATRLALMTPPSA